MKWDKVVCIYARKDGLFEGRFSTGRGKAEKRGYCYFHADSEEEAVKKLKRFESESLKRRRNYASELPEGIVKGTNGQLSADELRRILYCTKYNEDPLMLGVLFSLYMGLTTGELCALSWDDVDPGNGDVKVRHTVGKGD